MPTPIDLRMVPIVTRLLKEKGRDATFQQLTGYVYDAAQGEGTPTYGAPITTKVTPPDQYDVRFVDNDAVRGTDLRCYVGNKKADLTNIFSDTPSPGTLVAIDGVTYRVILASPITTGEFIALYELQLRR